MNRPFAFLCIAASVGLLGLDIAGVIIPLRNPAVYQVPRSPLIHDTNSIITADELWRRVERRPNEPLRDYVTRATYAVADGIAFIPSNDPASVRKFNRRIPIWENYLLWASRHVLFLERWIRGKTTYADRESTYIYVFSNYYRAIERGTGKCGQQSAILLGVLQEKGVQAKMLSFSHHALVTAEVAPGVWWILDPSCRTVFPFDLDTLRKDPALVRPYYRASGMDEKTIDEYQSLVSEPPPRPYILDSIEEAHGTARYYFGHASYYLIWIIPVCLLGIGFGCLRLSARGRAT